MGQGIYIFKWLPADQHQQWRSRNTALQVPAVVHSVQSSASLGKYCPLTHIPPTSRKNTPTIKNHLPSLSPTSFPSPHSYCNCIIVWVFSNEPHIKATAQALLSFSVQDASLPPRLPVQSPLFQSTFPDSFIQDYGFPHHTAVAYLKRTFNMLPYTNL